MNCLIERMALKVRRHPCRGVELRHFVSERSFTTPTSSTSPNCHTSSAVAGYRARLRGDAVPEPDDRHSLLRLIVGVGLTAVVMMLYLAFFYPTHLGLVEL